MVKNQWELLAENEGGRDKNKKQSDIQESFIEDADNRSKHRAGGEVKKYFAFVPRLIMEYKIGAI